MVTNEQQRSEIHKARGQVIDGLVRSITARLMLEHGVSVRAPDVQQLEDSMLKVIEGLEDVVIFGLRVDT
jgi:hypothetical protein